MSAQTNHPSSAELNALSLGQLPPDVAVAVESHVGDCQTCCETLLDLSSDDTFVELLQGAEQLPQDPTQDGITAGKRSAISDVPEPLAEHPRYEVLGLIGKGGMGDVYKARHRKMERTVALKVINRGLIRKTEVVDRFHREVKAAAQLSHANIVTAYDADQAEDFHFMVMEYVDGVDLAQTVKDRGALPIAEACDYIRQAANGLQQAHERGMVHRDIKPHNLMVTADGNVKILDFGLASLAPEAMADADTIEVRSDLTAAGAIMGTPDFISPEQADDARGADIRSDIYSLGNTLYFLLSGQPPFAEGSVMHKLKSHAQVEPEPLDSVRDDIPSDLADIISKMIAKDPDERFQTPAEVAEALERFVDETQPTKSRRPEPQFKTSRQKIGFLTLTAVVALLAAILVAGAAMFYIQTDNGTVRVKVMNDSLAVKFIGQTIRVNDRGKEFKIGAGEQRKLIVQQTGSNVELVTESFLIRRGDDTILEVDLLDGKIFVSKNGEPFAQKKAEPATRSFDGPPPNVPADKDGILNEGRTLVAVGSMGSTIVEYDLAGNKQWQAELGAVTGCWGLKTGERVVWRPVQNSKKTLVVYAAGDGPPRELWALDFPLGARQLPSDEILVWGENAVRRYDRNGRKLWETHVVWKGQERVPLHADPLSDGNVRVLIRESKKGQQWKADTAVEIDKQGLVVRELPYDPAIEVLQRLANGNVLVLIKEANNLIGKRIEERDPKGKVVWSYTNGTWVNSAQRLPNGNTLIGATSEVKTITSDGTVRWDLDESHLGKASVSYHAYRYYPLPAGTDPLLRRMLEMSPGVRQQAAESFIERGDLEGAKRILAIVPQVDSKAKAALDLAKIQEKSGEFEQAANAYLEAYRIQPNLLAEDHLATIIKGKRTSKFVDVFTEANLRKLGYLDPSEHIVRTLFNDETTRDDGLELLKRVWVTRPNTHYFFLRNNPNEVWSHVFDMGFFLRHKILPANIPAEGAGWDRFTIELTGDRDGSGSGVLTYLTPLLRDKEAVREITHEVETKVKQHPQWKAGVGLLAFLEAELGNEPSAVELLENVLAETEHPIPPNSAWVFGLALEGKGKAIDQIVMRLYERKTQADRAPVFPLRTSA